MASGLDIDVSSFVKKTSKARRNIVRLVAEPSVDNTADRVVRDARSLTPVDTGKLQRSVDKDVKIQGTRVVGSIFTDVEYAPFVHEDLNQFHTNGESKFIEKPFRRKAATELVKQVKKNFRRLR
jgi:hypothetical protein